MTEAQKMRMYGTLAATLVLVIWSWRQQRQYETEDAEAELKFTRINTRDTEEEEGGEEQCSH